MAQRVKKETKATGLQPLIGFVILLVVVGGTFLISPGIIRFITTQRVVAGLFGEILPVQFPPGWAYVVQRLVVTGFGGIVGFIFVMLFLFAFSSEEVDPTYVDPETIRKEKEDAKKRLKKSGKKRR